MHVLQVVGTRPNLVKTAPVISALRASTPDWRSTIVHTGQHYDRLMSRDLPRGAGRARPRPLAGRRLGNARRADRARPGATRARPAGGAPRSRDRAGRRQLDPGAPRCAPRSWGSRSLTWSRACAASTARCPRRRTASAPTSSPRCASCTATRRSRTCGPRGSRNRGCRFVGNTMIDTLVALEDRFRERGAAASLGLEPGGYLLVTLHRPALVDGPLLGEADGWRCPGSPASCRWCSRSTREPARRSDGDGPAGGSR